MTSPLSLLRGLEETSTSGKGGSAGDVFSEALHRAYRSIYRPPADAVSLDDMVIKEVAPWHRKPGSGYLGYLDARQSEILRQMKSIFPGHA